jgi:hypothetical protein
MKDHSLPLAVLPQGSSIRWHASVNTFEDNDRDGRIATRQLGSGSESGEVFPHLLG